MTSISSQGPCTHIPNQKPSPSCEAPDKHKTEQASKDKPATNVDSSSNSRQSTELTTKGIEPTTKAGEDKKVNEDNYLSAQRHSLLTPPISISPTSNSQQVASIYAANVA